MGSSINLHVLTLRRRQTVRDELLSIPPVYRLHRLSPFIIELANEPLCICVPVCKPVLGRHMLCIRKMNLMDLTTQPCFCCVSECNLNVAFFLYNKHAKHCNSVVFSPPTHKLLNELHTLNWAPTLGYSTGGKKCFLYIYIGVTGLRSYHGNYGFSFVFAGKH